MTLPSIRKAIILSPKQSVNEAFSAILRHNFDDMIRWVPVAYNREDIEGVHQVRVSLRRLRSAVSLFRKAIPRTITDPWNQEMRWVASEFGPARDLDVFIDEGLGEMAGTLPLPEGENKVRTLALQHQDAAYARLRLMLDSDRYKTFATHFDQWIKVHGWFQVDMPSETRAYMGTGIVRYARVVLSKRLSVAMAVGPSLDHLSDEALHQLRIECKKLRYATEFFSALFDSKGMAEFTLQLKGVQGLLGTMNDVAVMPNLLDGLLAGVKDPEAIHYAGALLGWRSHQSADVRKQVREAWKVFAKTPSPWHKK